MENGKRGIEGNASSITQTRDKFSEIVEKVIKTDSEWVISKNGSPVAVLLSFDEYESLIETLNILSDNETMEDLAEAEEELLSEKINN